MFPITDGHLGFNIPVNMKRCKDSDGREIYRAFTKVVMFTSIDDSWREHLREMDDLRQSVQNATYEQKDPLLIYKFESFELFSKMLIKVNRDVMSIICRGYIPVRNQGADESSAQAEARAAEAKRQHEARVKAEMARMQATRNAAMQAAAAERSKTMPVTAEKKVGRNDPCPCGSGKKYKACHGK